ncbi:MAG: SDR family NAD(P)-dependent oxidoreductase [bacterium]|nr:SDR family NAD(P)-dependent oxidoreductase [bacterium]MDY4109085.1 SDR family oxidoreductase [Bacilli bacterium]
MKTILVTGSAQGLGANIIEKFAKNGYNVIITYKSSKNKAIILEDKIRKYNLNVISVKCDITKISDIRNLIKVVKSRFNNIEVLVNNASLSLDSSFENKSKEEFMKVLETNIYGTFLITRELIKKYKVEKVINISSTDSIDTYSDLNIDYSLSKCGINFMTKFFSNKYKNIKFYNILPNWINTETIQNMNSEYLESELRRVNQNKLIEPEYISNIIYEMATTCKYDDNNEIRIDGD